MSSSPDQVTGHHPEMLRYRSRGGPDSLRTTMLRHPDIPAIVEDEVLAINVPSWHNSCRRPSAQELEALYEVSPGYLEVEEAIEEDRPGIPRDRSMSLPSVQQNFKLIKSVAFNIPNNQR